MSSGLNWVDYTVIAIFVMSGVAGVSRGVIREIISIASWVAAFFIASWFATPIANNFAHSQAAQSVITSAANSAKLSPEQTVSWLAFGLCFLGLFAVTLIVGAIVGAIATRIVEGGGISFVNRILGGGFGLARGFVIVVVIMFFVQLLPEIRQENWWIKSVFVHEFQPAVQGLAKIVTPHWQNLKEDAGAAFQNVNEALQRGAEELNNKVSH